ncbi:uncharacterized protein [Haliotis asinina]
MIWLAEVKAARSVIIYCPSVSELAETKRAEPDLIKTHTHLGHNNKRTTVSSWLSSVFTNLAPSPWEKTVPGTQPLYRDSHSRQFQCSLNSLIPLNSVATTENSSHARNCQ